jgi:glutaredoxin 3
MSTTSDTDHGNHDDRPSAAAASVVMYSSRLCGFCAMAQRLLRQKGVEFETRSVDGAPQVRAEMQQRAGRTSVPQIFIGDVHVGGCDDLYDLEHAGSLDALLAGR